MRLITICLLVILSPQTACTQMSLSDTHWTQDIEHLRTTVHRDYPFLFKKVTSDKFDQEVDHLIKQVPDLDDHQIIVGLAKLVSLFGYGHTNLFLTGWDSDNIYGFHQMPYNLYYFSDGVYIQGVHQRFHEVLGAKVLEVEGIPVLKALEMVRAVVPVENEQFFKAYAVHYLGTPEVLHAQGIKKHLDPHVTLTLEKNGKTFTQTFSSITLKNSPLDYGLITQQGSWLDARDQDFTPPWLNHLNRIYYRQYFPQHQAVYLRHSQIQDDDSVDTPTFYQEVFKFVEDNKVEKLILDLRLNGGGNNYKNKPIVTGIISSEKINAKGKLFVIIGRRTFSACQNLVNELDNYTEAIFVGEPTGENINFYGDNRTLNLPNSKIPIRLSFAWWQDKPPWENGPWLAPEIAVDMSFQDYLNNRDPSMEAILGFNDIADLVDPQTYLTELYLSGQVESILPEAKRLKSDPKYRYYPFQEKFNQMGYNLLNNEQYEPALLVFQLNTTLYPESPNAWDSLAEAYWRSGNLPKAIELYEKTMVMDPDGQTGENSRKMLQRIKNKE